MKLSGKQKMYGVVLAVGAAALIVDRMYFTPASTDAGLIPAATAVDGASLTNPGVAVTGAQASGEPVAEQLKQAAGGGLSDLPDAFAMPAAWAKEAGVEGLGSASEVTAMQFCGVHKLTAILHSGAMATVIVDGRLLRLGQCIDGFTLARVGSRWARFERSDVAVDLTMAP